MNKRLWFFDVSTGKQYVPTTRQENKVWDIKRAFFSFFFFFSFFLMYF